MKYDFTTVINRAGNDALAADRIPIPGACVKDGYRKIPMWIADMNFATLPDIPKAIEERLQHPIYGYYEPTEAYYEAIIKWRKEHNHMMDLEKCHIGYENGVLGCLSSALTALTTQGEAVLVHSPCYVGFLHVLKDLGRKVVFSELKQDENGVWRMDYEDMDHKIKENKIHFVIFCSPHNPTGRVWEKEEIMAAMEVYQKNNCVVVSDEIWADITMPGQQHIPTLNVSEDAKSRTIAIYAPSKTFNLAGLIGSYHIIYDEYLRDKITRQGALTHYNSMNVLSMHALIAAYSENGKEWIEELRQVLQENVEYAISFIREHFEGVTCATPQGTYMLYLDVSKWCEAHDMTIDELLCAGVSVGVIWQDGRAFGMDNTIRLNLASPKSEIEEAFGRLKKFVF